jgi:hypothetical protein
MTSLLGSTLGLLAAFVLGGCSSGSGPVASGNGPPQAGNSKSSHAIHVIAKHADGSIRHLSFGPATEATFAAAPGGNGSTGNAPQANGQLRILGTGLVGDGSAPNTGNDGGGTPVVTPPTVDQPNSDPWDTSWAIVWRAAEQCGGTTVDCLGPLPWQPFCLNSLGNHPLQDWFLYANSTNLTPAKTKTHPRPTLDTVFGGFRLLRNVSELL